MRAAWVVVAASAAAAAVVLPLRAHAILPRPDDVAVGWTLLVGSILSLRQMTVSTCLGLAGLLWVVVGLAPLGPDASQGAITRLALFPAALLVCAAACLGPRPYSRPVLAACALAVVGASVGGAGAGAGGLLTIGVAALMKWAIALDWPRAASAAQLGLGVGLVALGLGVAGVVQVPQHIATVIGLITFIGGGVVVGWLGGTRGTLESRGLWLDAPMDLERALGSALGTTPVTIIFPGPGHGWLDPAGHPVGPVETSYEVIDAAGRVLARTHPELSVEPALIPDLQRFLRAAGDGARLRAALSHRAVELDRSRARLTTAADEERRRLISRLELGPLHRLETIATGLRVGPDGPAWAARVTTARRTLDDLVAGLDPVESAGGLMPALTRLADAAGAVLNTSGDLPADLDAAAARAIWFACAEALANVRKHAPVAHVAIALDASDELILTVSDDGPGAADPRGAGLAGLADRLDLVGGCLRVHTVPVGTTLEARVPMKTRSAGDLLLPVPDVAEPTTVER